MTDPASKAVEIVHAFGRAWERRDIEAIIGMLHPQVEYQNVPVAALHGRDAVRAFASPSLTAATAIEWRYLVTLASPDGKRVLTERIDTFTFPEGSAAARLMGIFELEDGLIRHWRDYTDLGHFVHQITAMGRTVNPGLSGSADHS